MCSGIAFVLAQKDNGDSEIKNVIERFINSANAGDVDSAMQVISPNFYKVVNDVGIDYRQFRINLEKFLAGATSRYTDSSVVYIKILESEMQDNKVNVKMEYAIKAFDLANIEEKEFITRAEGSLENENGSWKITRLNFFQQPPYKKPE
jgi:hypothetical protein